jgi:hypothetical protein
MSSCCSWQILRVIDTPTGSNCICNAVFHTFVDRSAKCNKQCFGFIEITSCKMCDVDNTAIYTVQFGDDQLVMAESEEDFENVYVEGAARRIL